MANFGTGSAIAKLRAIPTSFPNLVFHSRPETHTMAGDVRALLDALLDAVADGEDAGDAEDAGLHQKPASKAKRKAGARRDIRFDS